MRLRLVNMLAKYVVTVYKWVNALQTLHYMYLNALYRGDWFFASAAMHLKMHNAYLGVH